MSTRATTRRAVIAIGTALSFSPQLAAAKVASEPVDIIASIYKGTLKTHDKAGALWLDPRDRPATLSKALVALWAMADAAAKKRGDEIGPIDWDVTTNSQGMTVKSFTLKTEKGDATHVVVVATLVPDNWVRKSPDENIIRYHFILESGLWKIDDVRGANDAEAGSLKDLLAKSLKS
jgi:hypothetical protein